MCYYGEWNVVFTTTTLFLSGNEALEMPLRLWLVGYVLQYVIHIISVCFEYKR